MLFVNTKAQSEKSGMSRWLKVLCHTPVHQFSMNPITTPLIFSPAKISTVMPADNTAKNPRSLREWSMDSYKRRCLTPYERSGHDQETKNAWRRFVSYQFILGTARLPAGTPSGLADIRAKPS